MNFIQIDSSIFESISKTGDGGVFDVNVLNLSVICCIFKSTSSTHYGGAFHSISSNIYLKSLIFNICRVTPPTDYYYGNAFYIDNQYTNQIKAISTIDEISHSYCGQYKTDGDSSIILNQMHFAATNMNSSYNTGTLGASLFSAINTIEVSYLKFCQDSSSTASTSIQATNKHYDCYFTNFINTKELVTSIVYTNPANQITFHECVFYNSHSKLYNNVCTFDKCQADSSFNGVVSVFTPFQSLNPIEMEYVCDKILYKTCRMNNRIILCSALFYTSLIRKF